VADPALEKAELRRRILAAMQALPPSRRALEEELVQAAVQAEPAWVQARTVLLYKAVAPELSVVGLTNAAWRAGKRVLFPRVSGPGALALHEVGSWGQLAPGRFGIPEPAAALPAVEPADVDLAIVPGVAWDADGHRLGRGGGYYDRLVPRLGGPAWGVGFACQRVGRLPREEWDSRVARTFISTALGLAD
jgi:5-formyltetrahydrofolate cyclo-ligase